MKPVLLVQSSFSSFAHVHSSLRSLSFWLALPTPVTQSETLTKSRRSSLMHTMHQNSIIEQLWECFVSFGPFIDPLSNPPGQLAQPILIMILCRGLKTILDVKWVDCDLGIWMWGHRRFLPGMELAKKKRQRVYFMIVNFR